RRVQLAGDRSQVRRGRRSRRRWRDPKCCRVTQVEQRLMDDCAAELDVLLVSDNSLWPLDQGYRVHGCHMAAALADLGLRVGVSTIERTRGAAAELDRLLVPWPTPTEAQVDRFNMGWSGPLHRLRRRLARHQGLPTQDLAG